MKLATLRTNCFSASQTSSSVWPGSGVAKEDDEVDGVAGAQRDTHLRVVLEAADARAVAGARIDDHVRPLLRIDRTPSGGTIRTSA